MTEPIAKKPKLDQTPKQIVCAVDIEAAGPRPEFPIIAIGVVIGDEKGNVIAKRKFCNAVPRDQFEKKCWDEFWSKNIASLEIIEKATAESSTYSGMIHDFHQFLFGFQLRHGPFGRKHQNTVKFRFVSDNPAYDIGSINLEFYKCGINCSLATMFDDYVPTDDPSEQVACLTPSQSAFVNSFVKTKHTHDPEDDAAEIYELWCGVNYFLKHRVITKTEKGEEIVVIPHDKNIE